MADTDDSSDAPRIYVACLHCYNSGRLHGAWFEVRADPDELHREVLGYFAAGCNDRQFDQECDACLAQASRFPCGGEELAVHDHEGLGSVGECYDLPRFCEIAGLLEEFPDLPVVAYLADLDHDLERAREGLRDDYRGAWRSVAEWAESWAEDADLSAAQLWPYVDWERYARDLQLGGDVSTLEVDGVVHVFWR
ncbi:MAG TPA: antirestriction protein ArdA [Planctomycetes bacterium]|nr:antirestriction protein ArdA [Planctomycetota bacterium]